MYEDLLGYLLNALDADEQQRIEKLLARDDSLRSELRKLRRCLEPLENLQLEAEPPAGLTDRTCDTIDQHERLNRPSPRSVSSRHSSSLAPRSVRFSPAEGVVIALVCLVAFTLFLPALADSRYQARKSYCQDNLRELGGALISYSERQSDRSFPFVPISGNRAFAGIFAPTLVQSQLIPRRCSWLICPGSDLAEENPDWFVPTLQQIDEASDVWLVQLQSRAGGSYAFNIGYVENGRYHVVKNRGRSHFALLGDAPSCHLAGRLSANHSGRGQNICYEDGHVSFVTSQQDALGDDPLRNRLGYAEAGVDRDDAVVLTSGMRPIVDTGLLRVLDSLPLDLSPQ